MCFCISVLLSLHETEIDEFCSEDRSTNSAAVSDAEKNRLLRNKQNICKMPLERRISFFSVLVVQISDRNEHRWNYATLVQICALSSTEMAASHLYRNGRKGVVRQMNRSVHRSHFGTEQAQVGQTTSLFNQQRANHWA